MCDNYFPLYNVNYSEYQIPNELRHQLESESEYGESIKKISYSDFANTIKLSINREFYYEEFKQLFDDNLPVLINKKRRRSLSLCKYALRDFESMIREFEEMKIDNESFLKKIQELEIVKDSLLKENDELKKK
jgi:hypothetical protein